MGSQARGARNGGWFDGFCAADEVTVGVGGGVSSQVGEVTACGADPGQLAAASVGGDMFEPWPESVIEGKAGGDDAGVEREGNHGRAGTTPPQLLGKEQIGEL